MDLFRYKFGRRVCQKRKRFFFCADQKLSHDALERQIAADAYHNQGKMPNNFGVTIPDYKRAFQAIQMFKDEYLLDYINVEQLGERDEDIDERVDDTKNRREPLLIPGDFRVIVARAFQIARLSRLEGGIA